MGCGENQGAGWGKWMEAHIIASGIKQELIPNKNHFYIISLYVDIDIVDIV